MQAIYTCLKETHDHYLLLLAGAVCIVGVYASFAIARHAGRLEGRARTIWLLAAVSAAGCTAWSTHMIGLLAFNPGMQSGFDPVMTAVSLLLTIAGIGLAISFAIGSRDRARRFVAGLLLGATINVLHYLGQSAYLVTGVVTWNRELVTLTILASLPLFGLAMVLPGERRRALRPFATPLLVAAIAILHFGGMAALKIDFDPRIELPETSLSRDVVAPIVALVSAALVILALIGLRFALNARAQVLRDQVRLKQLADLAVEGLAICEDQTIDAVNDSLAHLTGFSKNELSGRPLQDLLRDLSINAIAENEEQDTVVLCAAGDLVPVRVLRKTVKVGSRDRIVIAIRDQSERLQTEAKIRALAFSDPLTGLSNRLRFGEILAAKCSEATSANKPFSLLLLDLDRFKSVNDTLGHMMGDNLLKRVAARITACGEPIEAVARLGGDEFAVIVANAEQAGDIADKIIDLLSRPFLIEGSIIDIAASVGIAIAPQDGADPAILSRHADLALYAAKEQGGSVACRFDPEMSNRASARRALELDLRRALAREEFEVFYQPQVDPKTGRFQGAEALVRWRHPTRGMVSPADFIPLAEEIGLIAPLGEWVLRTACLEARTWPDHITVAINLSAVQLRDSGLAHTVARILKETDFPASRLELEITESALLQDETVTYNTLHALRSMGIRISMDDFGTGYSSLSYLRRFPFSKIKIDQSFVRQVPGDEDSVAIVQAITSLAAKLRMTVTVEGVETAEQRAFTVAEGCDQIQGYLISRPVDHQTIRSMFVATAKAVA